MHAKHGIGGLDVGHGAFDGGFAELIANYDTNADGTITSADSTFSTLRIWIDADEDGHTDSGELYTLASLGITSINLNAIDVNYQINGNNITQTSTFTMNGQTREVVDAWFAMDTVNTVYGEAYDLDARVL